VPDCLRWMFLPSALARSSLHSLPQPLRLSCQHVCWPPMSCLQSGAAAGAVQLCWRASTGRVDAELGRRVAGQFESMRGGPVSTLQSGRKLTGTEPNPCSTSPSTFLCVFLPPPPLPFACILAIAPPSPLSLVQGGSLSVPGCSYIHTIWQLPPIFVRAELPNDKQMLTPMTHH
jgi:hypothetical protein